MADEHIELERVINYYTREICDNRQQIDTIIKNFSTKVDLSVIMFAIDYAKLKNKGEISFIIDTLNEWIRFNLNTADKVKEHLGLSSEFSTSNNNKDESSFMAQDIEKEEIIREFKKKIGNRIGIEKDITELFKELEPKVVKMCIDYCSSNRKTDLPSFMETINEWKSSGLNTATKVEYFFKKSNLNLAPKTVTSSNTNSKTFDSKSPKSSMNNTDNLKSILNSSRTRHNNNKILFNEDSFNQIEYYYRKYFNDDDTEVKNIRDFCEQIDNSIVFRSLLYARNTNKNNYKYLESFFQRLKEKNISTLQELNNYLT